MLNQIHHGAPGGTPLIIVHGLYGSARNWGVIGKRLSENRHVIAVDQRNHGDSPWHDSHSYPDMAADLAAVIDANGGRADVVGHSMGGKAAMVLALAHPEKVARLVVADIAPVGYSHDQTQYIDAMQSVDLGAVTKRADASEQLARQVEDKVLQSFFTQSLDIAAKRWKLNLEVLKREMDKIVGFPEVSGRFEGPTLFLSGALSDYVLPEHRPVIRAHFPKARFARLAQAGHWLHAEKPREFEASLRAFLDA
ncbi:MAG: alpha/beta fold hydrolase [Marinovum algicola]|jgi:esterase|uniref:Pimeloyl-ACP methyl ester carboxylesterase n=1 Tax=Marinovum algicola TaxID=42444 RepID=A0A975W6A2_9RHOB|nr:MULTISPECIES: alpha/beta fold hydrolase [Marinovum]AKO95869.1 putative hydrolase or acyltransferase (alpha/beta hydrolase superfamily) [Marinovum algicola DG 898]MDD9741143.1 alpha/beta fold hydrolase [Marinovum sp. SP66]SEI56683.1 Pimeloyl-ACP methyl ester carboxylesterase [Marinovum algicola]SLN28341.1 Esterase YbfF [Marinovum algicola]